MVNDNGDIIYIKGVIGKYLNPAVGKASMNIFPMLKDGLREPFPASFAKVLSEKSKFVLRDIKIGNRSVNVNIQWVDKPQVLCGYVMITFVELTEGSKVKFLTPTQKKIAEKLQKLRSNKPAIEIESIEPIIVQNILLKRNSKGYDNGQLRATNEILQATNEELTSSREEMQSLNEELQTVNAELIIKADDYIRVTNDMKNLLNSTDIRILILDNKMNIRRYTTQATSIFKLIKTDIGRPLSDLV